MPNILHDINPSRINPDDFIAIIEIGLENKETVVDEEEGPRAAKKVIQKALNAYIENF